jgi:hypothetical protein
MDDATRYTVTFLMRTKDEALEAYKSFEAWALTQQHCKGIKTLCSDRRREYLSKAFDQHLAAAGTVCQLTTHDTPQLNGVMERLNRTLLERIWAFTHMSSLPKMLWGKGLRHATWLKNRTAMHALDGKMPYEALFGALPDLSELKLWGCPIWVHDATSAKLDVRARQARWIGLDVDAPAHCVYWPGSRNVSVERNIYFGASAQLEGERLHSPSTSGKLTAAPPTSPTPVPASMPEPPSMPQTPLRVRELSPPPAQHCSQRIRRPSRCARDIMDGEGVVSPSTPELSGACDPEMPGLLPCEEVKDHDDLDEAGGVWAILDGETVLLEDFKGIEEALLAETSDVEALEPRTLAEAKRRPDWPLWEKAILEELETLKRNGTWRLEEAPSEANVIGLKWVFKVKKDAAGNIACYKARLVAQGFSQIGVDYNDTYAPVAKMASSRAIIAMANKLGLVLHQLDIKGAYLNGILNNNEVLYMAHPPGYKPSDAANRVLQLLKVLYGLKQAVHRWYQKLCEIFISLGYKQSEVDQAVFYKLLPQVKQLIVVAVHVDDCTIATSTACLVEELKAGLSRHIEVTNLGKLHWMLGIQVQRDCEARTISISQHSYIDSILHHYHFTNVKPLLMPMDTQVHLTSEQAPSTPSEFAAMCDVPYREAVGMLNWAALAMHPNITFAVAMVAHFGTNPRPMHWEAIKRIFRYLAGMCDLCLLYSKTRRVLKGYVDADGSMVENQQAISGYTFLIDGGTVSWSSKCQKIVSLSTTESEYVAATHGMKEGLWLKSLLSKIFGPFPNPLTLFSNNQAAIALTCDHQYHVRMKHIDVHYHWIRWVVEEGAMCLVYCPTDDMVTDVLMKALPSPKVKHFTACLGLCAK